MIIPYMKKEGKVTFQNKGGYENPYLSGSLEHNIFERGWSQALKRTPETIIRERKATQITQEEVANELKRDLAKQAYLRSKGD